MGIQGRGQRPSSTNPLFTNQQLVKKGRTKKKGRQKRSNVKSEKSNIKNSDPLFTFLSSNKENHNIVTLENESNDEEEAFFDNASSMGNESEVSEAVDLDAISSS